MRRVYGLLLSGVILSAIFAVALLSTVHAALPFADTFSTGDTSKWDSVTNSTGFIGVREGGENDTYALLYNYTTNGGQAYAQKDESYPALVDIQFDMNISAWDKRASPAYVSRLAALVYYDAGYRVAVGMESDKNMSFYYCDGDSVEAVEVNFTFALGTWYNVELQSYYHASAGNASVWVDGQLIYSVTGIATDYYGQATRCFVGARYDYNGAEIWYDNVRIENNFIGAPSQDPVASFTATPNPVFVYNNVSFDASASTGGWNGTGWSPIASYEWDFNDTGTDTGVSVSHNFTQVGVYNVSLNVTDEQPTSDVMYLSVTVTEFEYVTGIQGNGTLRSETRGVLIKQLDWYDHDFDVICETLAGYNMTTVYVEVNPLKWTGLMMHFLDDLIPAAETNGLDVAVLFLFHGYSASYVDSSESTYYPQYGLTGSNPDWRAVTNAGNPVNWCSLQRNSTRTRIKQVIEILVSNYTAVTEINLDYIRFPDADADSIDGMQLSYDDESKPAFLAWLDEQELVFTDDWADYYVGGSNFDEWTEWRCNSINNIVRDCRQWAFAVRTNITFTADVWSYYAGASNDWYKYRLGQDPQYWISQGWLDGLCPMIYTDSQTAFEDRLNWAIQYQTGDNGTSKGSVPLIPFISHGGVVAEVGYDEMSLAQWLNEINYIRDSGCNGFIIYRYTGAGFQTSGFGVIEPYLNATKEDSDLGVFDIFTQTTPEISGTTISWATSTATSSYVEYSVDPLFPATEYSGTYVPYYDINYAQGTWMSNLTAGTTHQFTVPIAKPFYYRVMNNDSYITLASPPVTTPAGMITVTLPTTTTYTTSTIPVSISADVGNIDTIWYNCWNASAWVYPSNLTYTTPTTMLAFIDGPYTFYAWANDTDGYEDRVTVAFTVDLTLPLFYQGGGWWGNWWG